MAKADKSVVKQFNSLKQHLKTENPVLVEAVAGFEKLDAVAYRTGVLGTNESFAMQIPWWPLVSVLGVFSAGKSSFINSYLGRTLQKTGNQAVDDKFTVICYGKEKTGQVLPGLALDADMRFPFYRISKEIEQVSSGEGRRIDAYLQLKVTDAEILRGKIFIDSPGFDADDQRTATLQLTNHIIDISDLVLVFFDARHPEPGAMQDTLTHLVGNTIDRADSNKFLYILNQIDTAAREDNTEEITGAWQRALAQKGLTAGRFYTIYNKDAAQTFADDATQKRFETKRDADMAEIHTRINQIESERAYRIIGSLESEAYAIRDQFVPAITRLKKLWAKRVVRFDLAVLALLLVCALGIALATGTLGSLLALVLGMISNPMSMMGVLAGVVIVGSGVHFAIRRAVANYMIGKMQPTNDSAYISAFKKNTRFFRSLFRSTPVGWNKKSKATVENVLEQSSDFVQRLNDQFANPSG